MKHYTIKDHDFLCLIADTIDERGHVKNQTLADKAGLSCGAATARLFRLIDLGLVQASYVVAKNGRRTSQRTLTVTKIPDRPWDYRSLDPA